MNSRRNLAGGLLAVGGIVMMLATFLTRATVSGGTISIDVNGYSAGSVDGFVTDVFAVAFIVLGILVLRTPRTWVSVISTVFAVLGAGWALLVMGTTNNSSISPDASAAGVTVTVGFGVVVLLIGAFAALIGAVASFYGRVSAPVPGAWTPSASASPPPSACPRRHRRRRPSAAPLVGMDGLPVAAAAALAAVHRPSTPVLLGGR